MVKAVRGVDGRLPPASGRVQPHNSTDPGEFPYVSHLLGSLEAAGTRPLTENSRTRAGLGVCGSGSRVIHARSKTGWMGMGLRPVYCGCRSVASFSGSVGASGAAPDDRIACGNFLAAGRLVDANSRLQTRARYGLPPANALGALIAQNVGSADSAAAPLEPAHALFIPCGCKKCDCLPSEVSKFKTVPT